MMVMAKKKTKLLFVNLSKLFRREALGCAYAGLVTVNLLNQTAAENLTQSRRIHIMSQKSIRDKLKLMLAQFSTDGKSAVLAMNRQELADYLGGRAQRTVPRDGAHEKRGTDRLPEK